VALTTGDDIQNIKNKALDIIFDGKTNSFEYNRNQYTIEKEQFQISSNFGFSDNNYWTYKYNIKNNILTTICTISENEYDEYIRNNNNAEIDTSANARIRQANRKANSEYNRRNEECGGCPHLKICVNRECVDDPSIYN
jgi:hypothetical protein